ncbi:MAG: DNA mismatch repair protein MutS, partial [Pseudomonadales bacterium]
GSIVFLHSVEPGPASQSYGIQVARLAGVPDAVLREARARLQALEQAQAERDPRQNDLFFGVADSAVTAAATDSRFQQLQDRLSGLEPDDLTPRDALAILYELKALAAEDP